MAQFTFRAAVAPTVHWSKAGDKTYSGLAIVRETPDGTCADMFRLSDKTSPAEYRAFGAACIEAAALAEQCAVTAENAATVTFTPGQKARIAEALKAAAPAVRIGIALGLDVKLEDYGYATATGKALAEKPPTPPANGAGKSADAKLASVLGAVGK